jgi:hypothetical protein
MVRLLQELWWWDSWMTWLHEIAAKYANGILLFRYSR